MLAKIKVIKFLFEKVLFFFRKKGSIIIPAKKALRKTCGIGVNSETTSLMSGTVDPPPIAVARKISNELQFTETGGRGRVCSGDFCFYARR